VLVEGRDAVPGVEGLALRIEGALAAGVSPSAGFATDVRVALRRIRRKAARPSS